MLNFKDYENKLPCPRKPVAPKIFPGATYDEAIQYAEAVKVYEQESETWWQESWELNRKFKADALQDVGLAGHPKAQKIFNRAWERGHSSGYEEVYNILEDLAELVL